MSDPMGTDPLAGSLEAPLSAPAIAQEGEPREGGGPERPPFPPGCPVRPIGLLSTPEGSQKCYYLDVNHQLVGLEAGLRHGKNSVIALFGEQSLWLEANFPQWSKPITEYDRSSKTHTIIRQSEIVGFDQAEASRALIEQCAREGVFDPTGRMRGRGAHAQGNGGLVLHYGTALLAAQQRVDGAIKGWRWHEPGLLDGYVYPAAEPIPRPWPRPVGDAPAIKLLKLIRSWQWKRELLDARFLLGWIGAAMLGGALRWRPNIWITGGAGTGKSTINGESGVLDLLFGAGMLKTGNASAAAIRQMLKNSTVPVVFDEIEASGDNRRVNEVVELARVSSSGARMHRGGADHQAHEFTLRSCFQFSSINIPPLQPQDRSRLGILELEPFPAGAVPPVLREWNLPELGRQLARRMIDGWERFEPCFAAFAAGLTTRGHSRRGADQFGTLLACAHILLEDELASEEDVAHWVALCVPDRMAEINEATPDHEACLIHLVSSQVQARGGDEREALGSWIGRAVGPDKPLLQVHEEELRDRASDRLQQLGLKLVNARRHREERDAKGELKKPARWGAETFDAALPGFLAVANSHQGLAAIFKATTWQEGVWRQALARTPGALASKVKFGRLSLRAVLLPLADVLDVTELPAASMRETAAEWIATQMEGAEA
jgi:hypothetical protein